MRLVALALGLLALVVVAVGAWGRVSEGERALADRQAARDPAAATGAARAAAEAWVPGGHASRRGFADLERIAADARARGDDGAALAAWQASRAAALGIAVFDRRTPERAQADKEIAGAGHRIDAARATSFSARAAGEGAASEAHLLEALTASDVPSGWAFLWLGGGGVLFFWAAARFVLRQRRRTDLALAAAGVLIAASGVAFF